ncbi:hypothetical protein [Lactobacillus amylovorus]|uniref:hypothetical protein n=1 Tax=Lactobacillus amylovorus TaxID=1604 RepID=UPI003F8FCE6B
MMQQRGLVKNDNIWVKLFFVILYAAMAYFTFTGNMMMGMYLMAGGMLLSALLSLVSSLAKSKK